MATKKDRWQRLLNLVAKEDKLAVRESGYWAEDKLFFWNRYVEITTTAMVGNPNWPSGVVYVDLFSGPGVCVDRKSKRRFPGSPIIAANAPKPFRKILLCELDSINANACRLRMDNSSASKNYRLFEGDCNKLVATVVSAIPDRALALAFIDPTGLHVHFDTVMQVAGRGATDLLILFPDAVDILRNKKLYFDQQESNLDLVLGSDSNWRHKVSNLGTADGVRTRQLYADIYKDQLRKHAGFNFFGEEVISGPSGPLYRLVYATKHETGLRFWNESIKKDSSGQKRMF